MFIKMKNYCSTNYGDVAKVGDSLSHRVVIESNGERVIRISDNLLPPSTLIFVEGIALFDGYAINEPTNGMITFDSMNENDRIIIIF